MEKTELIKKIEELKNMLPEKDYSDHQGRAFFIMVRQFVKLYIGIDSEFFKELLIANEYVKPYEYKKIYVAKSVLKAIKDFLELGLDIEKTELYNTQIDVINDFLMQANKLCEDENFHPAAAAILIGASLEEFLRKLAERNDIFPEKQSIDSFAKELKAKNLIDTQDIKDITAWAGLRNSATHGKFEEVNDRKRIRNVLEGVNLFMRKKML